MDSAKQLLPGVFPCHCNQMAAEAATILEAPSLTGLSPGLERFKQLEAGRAGSSWASPSLQGLSTVFPDVSLKVARHLTSSFRAPEENGPRETRIRHTPFLNQLQKSLHIIFFHFLFTEAVSNTHPDSWKQNTDCLLPAKVSK